MIPDHTVTLSDGVNGVEFDVVAEVNDDDYSWSATAVLSRKSDGALFFVTDGGCSCNYFGSDLSIADLKPLHAFKDARAHCSSAEEWQRLKQSHETRELVYR